MTWLCGYYYRRTVKKSQSLPMAHHQHGLFKHLQLNGKPGLLHWRNTVQPVASFSLYPAPGFSSSSTSSSCSFPSPLFFHHYHPFALYFSLERTNKLQFPLTVRMWIANYKLCMHVCEPFFLFWKTTHTSKIWVTLVYSDGVSEWVSVLPQGNFLENKLKRIEKQNVQLYS